MTSHRRPVRLAARGITKSYGRKQVLGGVNADLRAGEVLAVVGENGAGKSTFLKICAGLISPDSGEVYVDGSVGYCPQDGGMFEFLRPDEHFSLFGQGAGLSRRRSLRQGKRLAAALDWAPDPKTPVRQLSGGTRQKLNVVLSTLGGHEILLLDEPYQGFDRGSYDDFWHVVRQLRDRGHSVMVITHMLNSMDQADRVLDLTPVRAA